MISFKKFFFVFLKIMRGFLLDLMFVVVETLYSCRPTPANEQMLDSEDSRVNNSTKEVPSELKRLRLHCCPRPHPTHHKPCYQNKWSQKYSHLSTKHQLLSYLYSKKRSNRSDEATPSFVMSEDDEHELQIRCLYIK